MISPACELSRRRQSANRDTEAQPVRPPGHHGLCFPNTYSYLCTLNKCGNAGEPGASNPIKELSSCKNKQSCLFLSFLLPHFLTQTSCGLLFIRRLEMAQPQILNLTFTILRVTACYLLFSLLFLLFLLLLPPLPQNLHGICIKACDSGGL